MTSPGASHSTPHVEPWLRGPVDGVDPYLQPAAHALLHAAEDVSRALAPLSPQELAATPGGAASVSFHARHLAGSLDRLFTYARGEALSAAQRDALAAEKQQPPDESAERLAALVREGVERALAQLRATPRASLLEARKVGRAGLPSTVLGLLFHAAEHTQRHAGQLVTTAKIVRGLDAR